MENLDRLFQQFSTIKVGVVGDVMLDTYMWGDVERISPEAPVPVVSLKKREQRIGGAGNVALNLQSLGAKPFVISITGKDDEADLLLRLFKEKQINTDYCISSTDRITTNKTRVISRNQHMLRLDAEVTKDLTDNEEKELLNNFSRFIEKEKPDIIILEDYNKGVLTSSIIHQIISYCKKNNILTAVDPKRKNFFEYKGADLFKPNLKEAKEALNLLFSNPTGDLLDDIHAELHNLLEHHISFITLSDKGVYYREDDKSAWIPSHLRNIADVSGAGDTVIAVAATVYAATKNVHLMAEIANIAGVLVCEEVGTAVIDRLKLQHECELLLN
jgi:rfaE bifunctional protein kinase chain/domain